MAVNIMIKRKRGDLSAYLPRGIAKRPLRNKQYPPRDAIILFPPAGDTNIGTHERFVLLILRSKILAISVERIKQNAFLICI